MIFGDDGSEQGSPKILEMKLFIKRYQWYVYKKNWKKLGFCRRSKAEKVPSEWNYIMFYDPS